MAGTFKTVVVELAVYAPEDNEHIYKGEEDFLEYVENELSELEYRGIYIERFMKLMNLINKFKITLASIMIKLINSNRENEVKSCR